MVTKHHKVFRGGGECFFKIDGGLRQPLPLRSGAFWLQEYPPGFPNFHFSPCVWVFAQTVQEPRVFAVFSYPGESSWAHPSSSSKPWIRKTAGQPHPETVPCTAVVQLKHPRSSSMTSCGSVPASFPPPTKPSANVLVCTSLTLVSQALCQVPGEENVLNK